MLYMKVNDTASITNAETSPISQFMSNLHEFLQIDYKYL